MFVYLDNSATTKPYTAVVEAVAQTMEARYGNPSSLHDMGMQADRILSDARSTVAHSIGATEKEIYFTSGGTESDNLALFGVWESNKRIGRTIITTSVEHPAVLRACERLEELGANIIYLPVSKQGVIDIEMFSRALDADTILVSVMHANNETGALMPIHSMLDVMREKKSRALFHTDAVQSYGKARVDVKDMPVDLLSVSGHKIHGPKGVGALYVRNGTKIRSVAYGGGQENGLRSGTENVPAIAGFACAVALQEKSFDERIRHLSDVKKHLKAGILEEIEDVIFHTPDDSVPSILNAGFPGCRGEVLLRMLGQENIFVSTGSACSSKKAGSHVLEAMHVDSEAAKGAIRFSFSEENTIQQMDYVVNVLKEAVRAQRKLSAFARKG